MQSQFTDKARTALQLAERDAGRMKQGYVGTEHILLGLLEEGTGTAARVLAENGAEEQEIRELIISLPEKFGMTVLVSSHLLSEIDQMADQVGIIDQGKLIFQDSLEVLHEHSRKKIYLRTLNQGLAVRVLNEKGIVFDQEDGGLILPHMPDSRIAGCVAALTAAGVGVTRIEERQKTLEEIFLGLTGKGASL